MVYIKQVTNIQKACLVLNCNVPKVLPNTDQAECSISLKFLLRKVLVHRKETCLAQDSLGQEAQPEWSS